MNAFDRTVLMMEALQESDLREIENFTKKLYMIRNSKRPFLPLIGEESFK